eukprot:TRINITY_DN6644_c1_g3_i1.p1 TRINITY_DN6644_c1_g3~~TRINITY_DN6644_c1_g3_i1.p1  ORF type:complete len:100 (-),score=27.85 TRINITY_DN6644_c1_g3_i1:94-393(-)
MSSSNNNNNENLSIGEIASRIAKQRFDEWVESSMIVIKKTVLDMAERGLFHCTIRFEDILPQDPINQNRFIEFLKTQHLEGRFSKLEESGNVQLDLSWS